MYGRIGGIVGSSNGTIKNNYSKTNLDIKSSGKDIYVGGISGVVSSGSLSNCYNRGDILVNATNSTDGGIGGIIGINGGTNSTFSNYYNCGNINVSGTFQNNLFVGGIIGYNRDATLENSCNTGNIVSDATVTGTYNAIGLIAGLNHNTGVINNSYYLSDSVLQSVGINWGENEVTAIDNLENMPNMLLILGNGFKEDTNNINNGYPILNWQ